MAGTFSVWGTSLIDKFKSDMERNPEKWEYLGDRSEHVTSSIWPPEVSVTVTFS